MALMVICVCASSGVVVGASHRDGRIASPKTAQQPLVLVAAGNKTARVVNAAHAAVAQQASYVAPVSYRRLWRAAFLSAFTVAMLAGLLGLVTARRVALYQQRTSACNLQVAV